MFMQSTILISLFHYLFFSFLIWSTNINHPHLQEDFSFWAYYTELQLR
jgi:hypothetical protein